MSNYTGTDRGYRVEIRAKNKPVQLEKGTILGTEWQPMKTIRVPPEVATSFQDDVGRLTDTHDYYGAIALAASFLSSDPYGMRAEARIIGYKREVSWHLEEVEVIKFPTTFELELQRYKDGNGT